MVRKGVVDRIALTAWLALGAGAGTMACTYRAGMDGRWLRARTQAVERTEAPEAATALHVAAGPCWRWPRLRASLELELAAYGTAGTSGRDQFRALLAARAMWLFLEGRAHHAGEQVTRTSPGLVGRLAVGVSPITERSMVEAGLGLAVASDSYQPQSKVFTSGGFAGDFAALTISFIAAYERGPHDTRDPRDLWLGARVEFEWNGLPPSSPLGGFSRPARGANSVRPERAARYGQPRPGESTDCDSGHLP